MKRQKVTSNACNYMKESNVKEAPHLGKDITMEKAKVSGFQGSGQTAESSSGHKHFVGRKATLYNGRYILLKA